LQEKSRVAETEEVGRRAKRDRRDKTKNIGEGEKRMRMRELRSDK